MSAEVTAQSTGSAEELAQVPAGGEAERSGLAVIWSRDEPERAGEVALVPPRRGSTWVLGRGSGGKDRLGLVRQRPGRNEDTGEVRNPRISRDQLLIFADGTALDVRNAGRLELKVNDVSVRRARLEPGDLVELDRELMLLVVRRPERLPSATVEMGVFGGPDASGFVGESPAAWQLRRHIASCASTREHVVVHGPSGVGKELVAQAIHRLSGGDRELVARNAATFPEGILDAELFGNLRDYPNPGMVARQGVIGEADGSTLFLDEIGEMSHAMQAHLLRVLDGGEYQRLGESRRRVSRFRLIAATNRPIESLKHDFLARLTRRIQVPGLDQRPEDIPLVARALLDRIARENPRLFPGEPPQIHPRLLRLLVVHRYSTHVREVLQALWRAIDAWTLRGGRWLNLASEENLLSSPPVQSSPSREPTRDEILTAYRRLGGIQARVVEALGLRDRFQLLRIEKRLGISRDDRDVAVEAGSEPEERGG